ncbi:MAG TPA: methyl-accepting chemotaxis protein [Stellaceae bacterium]|jgi:methyl-accepting chemotaxis protein|nr:methyl-accepting chemotaxis protein [Stellaceae bacterium]
MFGSWTFAKKLALGYGLAALTLLVIAAVSYRTTDELVANDDRLIESYAFQAALADLLSDLVDIETGARGYVVTGDSAFLEPYQVALGEVKGHQSTVTALVAGNPARQSKVAAMQPAIVRKLEHARKLVDTRNNAGFDAAAKLVANNEGKAEMDQIRAILGDLDRQESERIGSLVAAGKTNAQWTLAIILWGGLAGVVVVAAIGWLIIRSLTKQIGTAVQHVSSSSTELQAAANQQATGLREQATAMSEITTTITELLVTSRQIAESAQRVAQIAAQTAGGARSGQGAVDLAQDAIGGIRRQVDQIVAYMLDLGRKSQQIGAVLDIVSELAEQTNILAINATIEAAGAGDSGRRFAVVADEIRKLADRVGGSTKEIRALIDDVRSAVNTTVMATETGSKAVDSGSKQFDDVASGFRQIAELVGTTTDAAREIELSTKQQTTAVEQVNIAVANVAQASHETEASAGQTLQTASELAHLSTDLARIIRPQAVAA